MRTFHFVFWLADDSRDLLDWSNDLYEAGGDDTSPGITNGRGFVEFHREANSFEEAVRSALATVHAAGLQVLRCEVDQDEMAAWEAV